MKKFAFLAAVFAVCLWASDFWRSEPFTGWSDKDVQKMLHSSPWAREVSVSFGSGMSGGRGGRRGGGGGGGMGESTPGGGPGGGGGGSGRGGGGGGGGMGGDEAGMGGGAPSVTVTLTWESALPIRQARMRLKFGAEAATAPEARNFLGRDADVYVISVVSPMLGSLGGRGGASKDDSAAEQMKKAVMEQTSLTAKGKEPIKPDKLEAGRGRALFFFPKTAPFALDDKEIEFSMKVGAMAIKQKFHLKDMVVNGKLEL